MIWLSHSKIQQKAVEVLGRRITTTQVEMVRKILTGHGILVSGGRVHGRSAAVRLAQAIQAEMGNRHQLIYAGHANDRDNWYKCRRCFQRWVADSIRAAREYLKHDVCLGYPNAS